MTNTRMKAQRKKLNMSQTELAQKASATRQTIGLIEAGAFNPSLKLCLSICYALDVTLDEIFWEDQSHEKEK